MHDVLQMSHGSGTPGSDRDTGAKSALSRASASRSRDHEERIPGLIASPCPAAALMLTMRLLILERDHSLCRAADGGQTPA